MRPHLSREGFRRTLGPAERSTVIRTTNLPFSEWTRLFPNVQLRKALLGRVANRAHKMKRGRCQREKREAKLLNLPWGRPLLDRGLFCPMRSVAKSDV